MTEGDNKRYTTDGVYVENVPPAVIDTSINGLRLDRGFPPLSALAADYADDLIYGFKDTNWIFSGFRDLATGAIKNIEDVRGLEQTLDAIRMMRDRFFAECGIDTASERAEFISYIRRTGFRPFFATRPRYAPSPSIPWVQRMHDAAMEFKS